MGIKPLHYALLDNGQLIFASEIKALLAHGELNRELDPLAVEDYFAYGYIPEPRTVFRRDPQAGAWPHAAGPQGRRARPAQAVLGRAVHAAAGAQRSAGRRRADRPPARSGADPAGGRSATGRLPVRGVDSSAVVAMMAQESSSAVNTCSIAFNDARYDESPYAKLVAERYQTRHHSQRVGQHDADLIDLLAGLYDEPFADSSRCPPTASASWRASA
jgi:asparagine synthase (glutamine-hydrolysing)